MGGGYGCMHFGCCVVEMVVVGKEMTVVLQEVAVVIKVRGVVFVIERMVAMVV